MKKKSTFEFDVQTTALLNDLQGALHVCSKADVIRRALKITAVLTRAEQDGAKIYIQEKGEDSFSRVILV